jgi:hypothetical protein
VWCALSTTGIVGPIYFTDAVTADCYHIVLQQGLVLYLIHTGDLPTSDNRTAATFASNTAILATHEDPAIALMKLQAIISKIDDWVKKWRIKINQSKSTRITFTLHNQTSLTMQMGMQLDRRLTWAKHIKTKRKQLNQKQNECTGYSEEIQHYQ